MQVQVQGQRPAEFHLPETAPWRPDSGDQGLWVAQATEKLWVFQPRLTREAQTVISSPSSRPRPVSLQILSVLPLKPLRIQALLQPRSPQTSLFATIHHLSHRMASELVLPSLLWAPFTPLSNLLLKGSFYNVNPSIMIFQILGWLAAQ